MTSRLLYLAYLSMSVLRLGNEAEAAGQDTVTIYSFQRDVGQKGPQRQSYLELDPKSNAQLQTYSICYRIKFKRFTENSLHLVFGANDPYLLIAQEYQKIVVSLPRSPNAEPLSKDLIDLHLETWYHFCHVVKNLSHYSLYWQGKEFLSESVQLPQLSLTNNIIAGQPKDAPGQSTNSQEFLIGDMAQLNIWNFSLSASEIKHMAECSTIMHGNVYSLDLDQVQLSVEVKLQTISPEDFCRTNPEYVILNNEYSWQESLDECHRLGAKMVVPSNSSENGLLETTLGSSSGVCSSSKPSLWLGITKQKDKGVWIDINDKQPLKYNNFERDAVSTGRGVYCGAFLSDGSWYNDNCSNEKCIACRVNRSMPMFLRGLCFENEHQTKFMASDYIDGRIHFRGYYSTAITWNAGQQKWLLLNSTDNAILASMMIIDNRTYPFGRFEWVLESAMCQHPVGTILNMSFSACVPGQFMCSSGSCIPQTHRCDLREDCSDGGDEDGCQIVFTNNRYDKQLPSKGLGGEALDLTPTILLTRISEVDDMNMFVELDLTIKLTWTDDRLNFKHLYNKETLLTDQEAQKIWLPKYHLTNIKGGQSSVQSTESFVAPSEHESFLDHNSVNLDKIYPGSSSNISIIRQHSAKFTCSFELFTFPMDVQHCTVEITLFPRHNKHIRFAREGRSVTYTGSQQLSLFSVYHTEYEEKYDSHTLVAKFQLYRRQNYTLIIVIGPTVLLMFLSWGTLYVRFDALNVRAMMSVTLQLVLYTLFANTSRTLPITSDIKLLDLWFLNVTLFICSNIMIHIFVAPEKEREPMPREVPSCVPSKSTVPVIAKRNYNISIPYRFLIIWRTFIYPIAFVVSLINFTITCAVIR